MGDPTRLYRLSVDAIGRPAGRRAMAPEAVSAVLARNTAASVIQEFDKGRLSTRRSEYVYAAPGALYLPAWRHPRWLRRDPAIVVECHVSELYGLEKWSYVWARGVVTSLLPSDDPVENEAWQVALGHLQRVLTGFSRVAAPGLSSYGIVRVDILTLGGASLRIS